MHKGIAVILATFVITANSITPASLSRADSARGSDTYYPLTQPVIPGSTCQVSYAPGVKPFPTGARVIPLQQRPGRKLNSKRVHAQVFQSTPSRVWIIDMSSTTTGVVNPSGARLIGVAGLQYWNPEVEWRAATGTGDDASGFMILVNGIAETPDGCYQENPPSEGGGATNPGACGINVIQIQETTVSGKVYYSDPVTTYWACDVNPTLYPNNPNKKCKACGGQTGDPVNVVDGSLQYHHDDITMSGPFGLEFHRFYDSRSAMAYSQSSKCPFVQEDTPNGRGDQPLAFCMVNDLGFGWHHSYSAFLDLDQLNSYNQVSFFDEMFHRVYFGGVAPGQTVTEPLEGYSIYESSDSKTYKVTTWNGSVYQFACCYPSGSVGGFGPYIAYLTSITDRVGNAQTIQRNSNLQITTVTDTLGRSLSFTYDSNGQISQVSSSPSGAKVTLAYDSGTNCTTGELCSATENNGSVWNYQYSEDNITIHNGEPYVSHDLSAIIDPNNNYEEQNTYEVVAWAGPQWDVTYATSQTRGGNNKLTFSYPNAPFNTSTTVTDQLGRVTTFATDNYLRQTDSVSGGPACQGCGGNESVTDTWDNFDRLQSYTDGDGSTHTITYTYGDDTVRTYPDNTKYIVTPVLHITAVTEPLSSGKTRVTNYAWYPLGDPRQDLINVTTIPSADTSGQNKTITDTYSTTGLLQSEAVTGYVSGVSQTRTVNFTYDTAGRGRLTQITGPRTDVTQQTTLSYYPDTDSDLARRGQLQSIARQVSSSKTLTTSFASDASPNNTYKIYGNPLSATDPNGVIVDLAYDNIGELTSRTIKGVTGDTTPLVTSYGYDLGHRLTSVSWPLTNGVQYGYDASNDLLSVTRIAASTNYQEERISLGYDVMSQLTSQQAQSCGTPATTCGSWNTMQQETFKPDTYGRLGEVDHPCQPTCYKIVYTYDNAGNLSNVQDENHSTVNTTYSYDYANRLTKATQMLGSGNVVTSWAYDIQSNINSITDPNTNITTYAFTDFGDLSKQLSPVSGTSTYIYDFDSNLTQYTDANSATTNATYDAIDRILTSVSTRTGVPTDNVSWTYDSISKAFGQGRLTSVTDPSGSNSFSYDRRGLVKTETPIISSHSSSLSYVYDLNGNRTKLTYPSGTVATYGYDFADRPSSVTWGSTQIVTSATYEPFGPLANIVFGNGTTQALSYNQRYQPTENKLTAGSTLADYVYAEDGVGNITQIHDNVNSDYNRDFGPYDDLNRLTTANSGSSLWGTASGNGYTYDNMGNIKTITLGTAHTASLTYSGNLPQLTSVTDNTQNGGVAQSISYDAAGNETAVGSSSYTYSARNLLASGDGFNYTYDSRGIRTKAVGTPGTRLSLYNSDSSMLSESSLTDSAMIHNYVWFAGRPVAQVETSGGTNVYYNFTDHLGTPQIQTTSTASINWQAEYEPYARVFALRANDVHQPLRLPGQVAEQFSDGANGATGKSYNVYRWYRPAWGRYSQADPAGLWAGTNAYAYALGSPINYFDKLGLCLVQLEFHPIGAIKEAFHAFVLTTDPNGQQTFFRGGPINLALSLGPLAQLGSASGGVASGSVSHGSTSSNSANSSSPGASRGGVGEDNGPFGQIDTEKDPYTPGSTEWGGIDPINVANTPGSCECLNGVFGSYLDRLQRAAIPYNPIWRNSNSVARELLESASLSPPNLPFWLPGWNAKLLDQ